MQNENSLPSIVPQVFILLNTIQVQYAVLRNYKGLPYMNESRDIDIIIREKEYPIVKSELIRCFQRYEYKVVSFFESERLRTFVVGKIENEKTELIQFDFFVHTSAYGHILLTDEEILASRILTKGVYHVSKEFEFLDKYLYLKYIGAEYPSKYSTLKEQMGESLRMEEILNRLFNIGSLKELEEMSTKEFRKRNKAMGRERMGNVLFFWKCYIKNAFYYKGYSIGVTGPDGSGKTTVINMMKDKLQTVYPHLLLFHFRPSLIYNLGEMAHSAGLKKEVDREYDKPHRGGKTGYINSVFRLCYYSIDYILGYWLKVRKALFRRRIVVFDRYYTDIICDSRRSRIYLNPKFIYWFGRLFIPSLEYNILLTADSEIILARKRELDKTGIDAINTKIDYLATKKGYYKVKNQSTPQTAVQKVLKIIFEEQHRKNLKRMKHGNCKI